MGEFFRLLYLFFKVKGYLLWEEQRVVRRFYRHSAFRKQDLALKMPYLFRNPYRLSKAFLRAQGIVNVHQYGETPLTTLDHIARECGISASDHVVELGSGRGRGALFLRHFIGCSVTGLEWVPLFVELAQPIAAQDSERKIRFFCSDFQRADLSQATCIYLYGTCLEDPIIHTLAEKCAQLIQKPKIITVSFPLSDYSSAFHTLKQFPASFPWGKAEIYLNLS